MKITEAKTSAEIAYCLSELGRKWSNNDARASFLEENKKTVLSQLALKHPDLGVSKAENMALADPVYQAHINAMVEARKEANIAKVDYDTARAYIDLMRTEAATRRAEINLR